MAPYKEFSSGADLGIIDPKEVMSKYPAVATKIAMDTASEAGLDPNSPETVVKVMHSRTYGEKVKKTMAEKQDDRFISRLVQHQPTLPGADEPVEQQQDTLFATREKTVQNTMRARGVLGKQQVDANAKLDTLLDFDRESFKAQRLKEMNPTGEIDGRILQIRMQAFTAKSMLRSQYRHLDPVKRNAVIAARMQTMADTISGLKEIRDAKKASAETQIEEEITAKNDELRTARAKVNALKGLMDTIEQSGQDTEALSSIRMDWLQAKKKATKAGSGTGTVDEEETLVNAILNDYRAFHGDTPSTEQKAEAKRQAQQIIKNRTKLKDDVKRPQPSALRGVRVGTLMTGLDAAPLPGEFDDKRASIYDPR